MRAAWYETNGAARDVLRVGEMPDPEPGPGEVRVRLSASGVNPSDVKTRGGSRRVREATGGRGVDRVVEVDAATNMRLLPQIVRRDGLCVVYGSSRNEVVSEFGPMIMSGTAVRWFIVYELSPEARRDALDRVGAWLREGSLRHAVAQTFPLAEIAAAHEAVEAGRTIGNVVLEIG